MGQLATLLETHQRALSERWLERLRQGLAPGVEPKTEPPDHVPEFLDEVVAALRKGASSEATSIAAARRRQRHRLGFDLEAIVREYAVLRDCIFDLIDETGALATLPEIRILTNVVAESIAVGVREHARQRAHRGESEEMTELVETRRRIEDLTNEVRTSESLLRLVTDALPALISFIDAGERYRLINKAYEDWFGQTREELVGRTVLEMIGAAAYEKIAPFVRRGLAGELVVMEQHQVPYRIAGLRDVKVTFVPHFDRTGRVGGVATLLQDITAQRLMESERARLASQRTEVLESMGDGFFAVDREWRVSQVNRRYEAALRTTREEILGRNLWELFPRIAHPESRIFQEYHRCMRERVEVQLVDHHVDSDTWTDVRAYPTSEGGIAAFFRDVTAQMRAEETLRQQTELEQQLIGIVSHDLRNPLNVILLGSQLLTRREDLSESATKNVIRIQNAAERSTRMVRDLLDFTQARLGGGIHVEPRAADIHAIVRSVIEEIEAAYPSRRIVMQQSGDGEGEWDPDRLAQVVQNLVTNAVKYSPDDTPVQVAVGGDAETVTLTVHNLGAPIATDKLRTLFEPFQRAVAQSDKASRSVGLGLYIVKHIVDAHRGSVQVESSEAEGTTFTLQLSRHSRARAAR